VIATDGSEFLLEISTMAAFDTVIRHGAIAQRNLGDKGYGRYLGRAQPFAPLSMPPHR
jgi:hypothetical protein